MSDSDRSKALGESCEAADETMGSQEPGGSAEDCPSTWISIQVVDAYDRPLSGQEYRIELPDGRVLEGAVDAEGIASVENIREGDCSVTLRGLEGESWEYVGTTVDSEE